MKISIRKVKPQLLIGGWGIENIVVKRKLLIGGWRIEIVVQGLNRRIFILGLTIKVY